MIYGIPEYVIVILIIQFTISILLIYGCYRTLKKLIFEIKKNKEKK